MDDIMKKLGLDDESDNEIYDKVDENIADWLKTLSQVHKSKSVHSDHNTKKYTQADIEMERARIFDLVINFLSKHSTYSIQCYSDTSGIEIIPEFNNLVFNKHEIEDIIILQPISDEVSAEHLQDIASNIDRLRDLGYFNNKPVMVIDSSIRLMKARLIADTDTPDDNN